MRKKQNMRKRRGSNQHIWKYGLKKDVVFSLIKIFFITLFILLAVQAYKYYFRLAYYQWRDANIYASPCANFCNYAGPIFAAEPDNEATLENITAYIIKRFGPLGRSVAVKALSCFISESGLREDAYHFNSNNTSDYGIAQINSIHLLRFGDEFMTDWKANIDVAYQIYKERGFSAWYGAYCK